jgi:hypothetical protein
LKRKREREMCLVSVISERKRGKRKSIGRGNRTRKLFLFFNKSEGLRRSANGLKLLEVGTAEDYGLYF